MTRKEKCKVNRNRLRNERDHGMSRQELLKSHYKYSGPLNDMGLEMLTPCTAKNQHKNFDFPKT